MSTCACLLVSASLTYLSLPLLLSSAPPPPPPTHPPTNHTHVRKQKSAGLVTGYTWITFQLRTGSQQVTRTRITNVASYPETDTMVYAVAPDYMEVVYPDFVTVTGTTDSARPGMSLSRSLYAADEKKMKENNPNDDEIEALVCTASMTYIGAEATSPLLLEIDTVPWWKRVIKRTRAQAVLSKLSGWVILSIFLPRFPCPI